MKSESVRFPTAPGVLLRTHQLPRLPSLKTGEGGRALGETAPPSISRPLLAWFTWYSRRYLRRHFHSLRLSRSGLPPAAEARPIVIYSNHASWWDPLVCLVLKDQFFRQRNAFAPIDAAMLERYKFFSKLGFFGVEPQTPRGATQFIRTSDAILRSSGNILAITPQARFVDARERPLRFVPGLGHLATRVPHACFAPIAIEYVFWEERLPEILIRFGEPIVPERDERGLLDVKNWTRIFEEKLTQTQEALSVEAQRRRPEEFQTLLCGGAGQGGVYDLWRWFIAQFRGGSFNPEHGKR